MKNIGFGVSPPAAGDPGDAGDKGAAPRADDLHICVGPFSIFLGRMPMAGDAARTSTSPLPPVSPPLVRSGVAVAAQPHTETSQGALAGQKG